MTCISTNICWELLKSKSVRTQLARKQELGLPWLWDMFQGITPLLTQRRQANNHTECNQPCLLEGLHHIHVELEVETCIHMLLILLPPHALCHHTAPGSFWEVKGSLDTSETNPMSAMEQEPGPEWDNLN